MASAVATAAADKLQAAALGLQPKIFKSTMMPDEEKRRMLETLRRDAATSGRGIRKECSERIGGINFTTVVEGTSSQQPAQPQRGATLSFWAP